jgi:DNA-binding MarR family transcriptional regulator
VVVSLWFGGDGTGQKLSMAQIARLLGIDKGKVARILQRPGAGHHGDSQPPSTTTRTSKPLAGPARTALDRLADLGVAGRSEWLKATGLPRATVGSAMQRLVAAGYVETRDQHRSQPVKHLHTDYRVYSLTERGQAVVDSVDNATDAIDHPTVRQRAHTLRACGASDLAIARSLNLSPRSVRVIAGRRTQDTLPCTPCAGCGRPILRSDARGLCSRCAQRCVPASASLVFRHARSVTMQATFQCQCATCTCGCSVCQVVGHVHNWPGPASPRADMCHACGIQHAPQLMTRLPRDRGAPRSSQRYLCEPCYEHWLTGAYASVEPWQERWQRRQVEFNMHRSRGAPSSSRQTQTTGGRVIGVRTLCRNLQ